MTSTQQLCGALAAAALFSSGCNRIDATIDREKVREEAGAAAAKAGDTIADGWLTTKIQAQFFADEDIRARDIVVTAKDGVVVLKGRVPDEDAHRQAVQTAKNTDGVKQLVNELTIGPDLELPRASPPVSESAREAVATTGAAASDVAARALALVDDARIVSTVQSKYFLDDRVKGRHINVDARQGVVTLRGEVGSEAERREALLLARGTAGVRRVEDSLSVNASLDGPGAAPSAESAAATAVAVSEAVTDTTITTRIQAKYFLDRDVKAGGMDVTTKDGVVLLEGTVPTQAARDRAIAIAQETTGVIQVVDRLQVQAKSDVKRTPRR